ncbi:MAG: rhodanese-like domain-containing protein [Eubacteriales bacterium]|nr:rhodanese-like domain-containing protein [Clostridiales bacterium]MDY5835560.1 rhodanese-like domain-containing protein [Eubacteriales bacterium]
MKKMTQIISFCLILLLALAGTYAPSVQAEDQAASFSMEEVDAEAVKAALEDETAVVVDTRTNDQFNGWSLSEDDLAGHIQGATDFSYRWLEGNSEYSDEDNLEGLTREDVLTEALAVKGIVPEKTVILYDTNGSDAQQVADYLAGHGFEQIKYFNAKAYKASPVVAYANYQHLIAPPIVKDYVEKGEAESLDPDKKYFIFDVSWGDEDVSGYLDGHVPTAIHVNTDWFEPEELGWMLDSDENLLALAARLGITKDDAAIVTGPEPMAATRFGLILQYLGVEDVRYMNGALVNWQAYGYNLETESTPPDPVDSFGSDKPLHPEIIINQEQAQELLDAQGGEMACQFQDNRTREEYQGKSTGYSYHDKAGRMAGAIYGWAGINENSSSMYYYRNVDKTMRNGAEILALLKGAGFDLDKPIVTFCGSGWRAAETVYYYQTLGRTGDSLYSDGWIGWSNNGRDALYNEAAEIELPEKPVLDFDYDVDFEIVRE